MERTLLLNQSYEPISAIHWKRAMCLIVLNKAEMVEEYDQKIHSATNSFPMPAVIRLVESFKRYKKHVKFSKKNIFARDHYRCCYCGVNGTNDTLTCDHILAKAKGGTTCFQNVVTSCKECNSKKADKSIQEAGMNLICSPYTPDWIPFIFHSFKTPEIWNKYIFR